MSYLINNEEFHQISVRETNGRFSIPLRTAMTQMLLLPLSRINFVALVNRKDSNCKSARFIHFTSPRIVTASYRDRKRLVAHKNVLSHQFASSIAADVKVNYWREIPSRYCEV